MPEPIQILLVEESQENINQITARLRDDGLETVFTPVNSLAGLEAVMRQGSLDAVVAACRLADFDAQAVLEVLKAEGCDLPLIVIEDAERSEDFAISLVRAGARDFVMRDHMAYLALALRRELEYAEQRRVLRKNEDAFRLLFQQASDGILISNHDGSFNDANPSGCSMLGYTREEFMRLRLQDLMDPDELKAVPLHLGELHAGQTVLTERTMLRKDGSRLQVEISARQLADGRLQGIVRDITARKRVEQEILRMDRVYAVISQINQMVARAHSVPEFLEAICTITVDQGKFRMAWVGLVSADRRSLLPQASAGVVDGYLVSSPPMTLDDTHAVRGPTATAIATGNVYSCNDIANDPTIIPWREAALERGYRSMIALPIVVDDVIAGTFSIYAGEANFFNASETDLLLQLSRDIGFALDRMGSDSLRRKAEQHLVESESRFSTIFQASPESITLANMSTGRFIDVNPAFCSIFGLPREQVIGKVAAEASIWADPEERSRLVDLVRQWGKVTDFEAGFNLPNGEIGDLLLSAQIITVSGEDCLLIIGHDITLRKRAEQALAESQKRLRSYFSQPLIGFSITSVDKIMLEVNERLCAILGYTPDELITKTWAELTHPGDLERDVEQSNRVLAGEIDGFSLEKRFITRDGRIIWASLAVSCVRKPDGSVDYFIAVIEDITDRIHAQQALARHEERFRLAMEASSDGLWDWDGESGEIYFSPACYAMLGYGQAEFVRDIPGVVSLVHEDDRELMRSNLLDCVNGLIDSFKLEYRMRTRDGQWKWVLNRGKAARVDPSGRVLRIIGTQVDITERRQSEEELREAHNRLEQRVLERTTELKVANTALEKAARMKDEFMASMSHELRTPLTGILGLTESLLLNTYGELLEEQANAMRMIEKSGHHLLDLINEVLDLSKIEAGKLELQLAICSLDGICQASLQMVNSMAHQKNLQTSFSMHPVSITMRADARRLKQMIVNLLSNAVKFTPENGSIGIDIFGNVEQRQISIAVWDAGIGIRPEDLPRLFQPFVQLDSSLSRQYSGTGLGLALVQRLAELHGGRVEVESVLGQGSRFTVLLPWENPDPFSPPPRRRMTDRLRALASTPPVPVPGGPMILAVDDNPIMLEVFGDYLGAQNFGFIASNTGVEFLEQMESARPDILLVDIQMPGMDGIEIIRRVRNHSDEHIRELPIIAVTALAMTGDRERCLAAGANEYLSKPVELTELASMLRSMAKKNGGAGR